MPASRTSRRSKWDSVPIYGHVLKKAHAPDAQVFLHTRRKTSRGCPWSKVDWPNPEAVPPPEEFVVQRNGQVRQAGASLADDHYVSEFRLRAEGSLYIFSKSVLNRRYFTPRVHLSICNWLQERMPDPDRKMMRMFREAGKTSMVSHATPLHVHIQSKERNVWFPGEEGCEQRILLVKETIEEAMREVRVVKETAESNELLRALWPHRFWEEPRKQSDRWSPAAIIHPRKGTWPDESLRAVGVGGAIAGKHPSMVIKDDIISFDAANSETEMETAIAWHLASRALINRKGCLEIIIGTPWAIHDVYSYIEHTDNRDKPDKFGKYGTVSVYDQPLVVDGECVYPEFTEDVDGVPITYGFSQQKMEHIQREDMQKWLLQYQITVVDKDLVDFSRDNLRYYTIVDGKLRFDEDARDAMLTSMEAIQRPAPKAASIVHKIWDNMDLQERRKEFLRSRWAA